LSVQVNGQLKKEIPKANTFSSYNYIAINNCKMWVSNNGQGSNEPSGREGFLWPGGEQANKSLVYQDGLIWGGIADSQLVVGGNYYNSFLNAGKVLSNGERDDSSLAKYRVYKIRKDWEQLPESEEKEAFERDYYEWPVDDGAPWIDTDKDGKYTFGTDKPYFIGDEVLWYVANDIIDPSLSLMHSKPIGLEIQTTVFAFNKQNAFNDIIFKKYKIINKGKHQINDFYVGQWADVDLGYAADDFAGCDTSLSLAYVYNSKAYDNVFSESPPSIGYQLLNVSGSKNPMISFTPIITNYSEYSLPHTSLSFYSILQGKTPSVHDQRDPLNGKITKFALSGDPVFQTGWYEGKGWPKGPNGGDRHLVSSTGPFNMNPNDTIEVVLAIIVGNKQGNLTQYNYLLSVMDLKDKALTVKKMFEKNFDWLSSPPSPVMHYLPLNNAVKLWWENDAESYDETDPFIDSRYGSDTTYTFEGYRLWQYSDSSGTDSVLLATFDLKNNIRVIRDYKYYNGALTDVPVIVGTDAGLEREITITSDAFSNYLPLYNYSPYYFGVTAYAYNEYSSPEYLESPVKIIKVIPGQKRIDVTYPYTDNDAVAPLQVKGNSDSRIKFNVVDPTALTGDTYQVIFTSTNDTLKYSLYNKTKDDTLLVNQEDFTAEKSDKPVIDGFILTVEDIAKDSIAAENTKYRVKSILEIKGKDGVVLSQPIDIMNNLNSTNRWQVKAKGTYKRLNWQVNQNEEGLGYDDYELRFTGTSKYYYSGYARSFNPIIKNDNLASDLLPFEVWCIGRNPESTEDDYRLAVKIWDNDRFDSTRTKPDSMWTHLENNDWEEIFAYKSSFDPADPPQTCGNSKFTDHKFGCLAISGELPDPGTVIRIVTYKPLADGDVFEATLKTGNLNDKESAKTNIDKISVFPNPYFGGNDISNEAQNFIRFTSLPRNVTIRIYNIAGVFIRKLSKDDFASYLDWDLQNEDGKRVGSGMFVAHIEMPEIGNKIMKIAVIQEKKYLNSY